jgi:ABC-type nitrate/sulfonate/bicarbonate transport system substrate-binding protein
MAKPSRRQCASLLLVVGIVAWIACSAPAAAPAAPASARDAAKPATGPTAAPTATASATPVGPPHSFQLGVVALAAYFFPVWIGVDKGFFAEQGLDVEITTFQTNEAVAALVSGSLDVLFGPTDALITAVSKGAQIKVVNDYLIEAPYDLVAKPDVATVADLRDKKIGVSSLSAGTGSLAKIMLRAHGFGPDDYQLVQAGGNPQRFAALQSGGVDAALLSDPVNFQAALEGYHSLLNFTAVVPQYSFASDWVQQSWLNDTPNRDYLVAFQAGQIKANGWAQNPANKAAFVDLIVNRARTTPVIAERIWDFYTVQNKTIVGVDDLRREPADAVVSILREMEGLGALPPDAEWRDGSFVQRARQVAAR